jgi:hypothetical protein
MTADAGGFGLCGRLNGNLAPYVERWRATLASVLEMMNLMCRPPGPFRLFAGFAYMAV